VKTTTKKRATKKRATKKRIAAQRPIKGAPADVRRHEKARRAIDRAEDTAGGDDRQFLEAIRRHAMEPASAAARSRTIPGGTRHTGPRLDGDPRYLANVRALARRSKRNARIIGGSSVVDAEFDDCVAVGDDFEFGCTGTLIAPNVVLTAGHCEVLHTRIFIGNDLRKHGRVIRIARHVRHPQWGDQDLRNDVMLLFLERNVTGVKPRALASTKAIDAATDGRVVGYGTTNLAGTKGFGVKRQADVPIVSSACKGRVGGDADANVYGCHLGKEIVAGKPVLERDTCKGDSGGPFYVAGAGGRWVLGGVTSRGTDGAKTMCGDGGMYVRVDRYRTWISAQMRQA
jgi:secreted trypsin-like serine protease